MKAFSWVMFEGYADEMCGVVRAETRSKARYKMYLKWRDAGATESLAEFGNMIRLRRAPELDPLAWEKKLESKDNSPHAWGHE